MRDIKRSGNLRKLFPKKIIKHKSLSKSKESDISNVKNAGSNPDESGNQSNTLLYDVYTCPLSVYIDITCNEDKIRSLIIKGDATLEELENARFKLISDFADISNNGELQAYSDVIGSLYYQRNIILGYELSLNLIIGGKFDTAIGYLNKNGIQCYIPQNKEELKKLVDKILLKRKNRLAKLKEAQGRYNALSSGKGEKPTRRYYNKLLVMLSTCEAIKMQLKAKEMTVAEFAEYINMFNEYQNQLKVRKNKHG
ncbi:hypothetical protein [Dysgonomonas sp. BGC7]|uniref:hypothetical protein n=1 Tax=Dysgonomonas sp. BGC7 TaxID=1658008 RepID=UPI000680A001|nr:hypothetical protein [Dysgonomonas sp. BGC7]MBD8389664.1 hypothetical protein [Dysgonomonas sp. BGC7]